MKTPALIVIAIATAFLVSAASSQDTDVQGKDQQKESSKKIKELQKERVATLKEMADAAANLVQRGAVSIEEACEARLMLLRAEIDTAETDSDRIKRYEDFIEWMKQYEEIAIARKMAARGTHVTVLRVKASRLEAEIALEQLKAKAA